MTKQMTTTLDMLETSPVLDKGRSFWATALLRLRKNKAALVAIAVLIIYGFLGLLGPKFSPHDYAKTYQEFVKTPASFQMYPKDDTIIPAAQKALKRANVTITDSQLQGEILRLTVDAKKEVDPRVTRYLTRSDFFSEAHIIDTQNDGKTAIIEANIQRYRFLMGTDANGRDLLARILVSIRMSLMVALLATTVALSIGVLYGATAGFVGGRIDNIMMRFVDIMYALPFMFFVILLVVFFGRNIVLIFIAIGCVEWLDMARITRGQTISLRRREFVQAAESLGVSSFGIVWRHIIPNVLGPVIIYMTLLIPRVILLESFLSFLGLGVQEPLTSLGVLISEGAKNMQGAAYMLIYPSIALTVLLFALNFLGDGLRDALDPKDR